MESHARGSLLLDLSNGDGSPAASEGVTSPASSNQKGNGCLLGDPPPKKKKHLSFPAGVHSKPIKREGVLQNKRRPNALTPGTWNTANIGLRLSKGVNLANLSKGLFLPVEAKCSICPPPKAGIEGTTQYVLQFRKNRLKIQPNGKGWLPSTTYHYRFSNKSGR